MLMLPRTASPPTYSMFVFVQLSRYTLRWLVQGCRKLPQGIEEVESKGPGYIDLSQHITTLMLPRTASPPTSSMFVFVQLSRHTLRWLVQGCSKFPQGIEEVESKGPGYIDLSQRSTTLMLPATASPLTYSMFVLVQLSRHTLRWLLQGYIMFSQGMEEVGRVHGTLTLGQPTFVLTCIDASCSSLMTHLLYACVGSVLKTYI